MEPTRHKQTVCINQQPQGLTKLIRQMRWIGMEEEAHGRCAACLQMKDVLFWRDRSAPTKVENSMAAQQSFVAKQ